MNPTIETIVNACRDLMDGQQPPPAGPKLEPLENAIRTLQKHNSAAEYEFLGRHLVGVVIDRVSSNINAEITLRKFISGGDHA